MRVERELEIVEESDRMGDNVGERGEVVWGDSPIFLSSLPPTLYTSIILVLKLTVPYLISLNTIIVLDKTISPNLTPSILPNLIPSSKPNLPHNPPYYITITPIIASDKDIPPNPVLVLIIVSDKAFALAPNA